jgi:hypothetical protein
MTSSPEEHAAFLKELNKTVQIIFSWPRQIKQNAFFQCSNFLKKIESLFKVDSLAFFSEPPSDSSSEKDSEGATEE